MRTIEIHVPDNFRYEDEEKIVDVVTKVARAVAEGRGHLCVERGYDTEECYCFLAALDTADEFEDVSRTLTKLNGFEEYIIDGILGNVHI